MASADVPYIRKSKRSDATNLAKRLRAADLEEITAHTGLLPRKELLRTLLDPRVSKAYSIVYEQRILGIFGVTTTGTTAQGKVGAPWLLSTDELIEKFWKLFIRESRKWLDHFKKDYVILENHIYAKNSVHIEWVKWLGFELVEFKPRFGVAGKPFWKFQMHVNPAD